MNTPRTTIFSTLTWTAIVLPLSALLLLGWTYTPTYTPKTRPASHTPLSPAVFAGRHTPFAMNVAMFAGQNPDTEFSSFLSNLCLQPLNQSKAQGAAIVQQPCNSSPAQQWTAVPVSGDVVHYVNQLSGLCLDARGGAANRTPVQQWTCNKISNENWEPTPYVSDEVPSVYSRVSGTKSFCLDVPGGSSTAGLAMQIYRCNGTLAQLWWTP